MERLVRALFFAVDQFNNWTGSAVAVLIISMALVIAAVAGLAWRLLGII